MAVKAMSSLPVFRGLLLRHPIAFANILARVGGAAAKGAAMSALSDEGCERGER